MTAEDKDADGVMENGKADDAKKAKKPKVTIFEAAFKIDADYLSTFLTDISASAINLFRTCSENERGRGRESRREAGIFYPTSSCYNEANKTFFVCSSVLLFDKVKTSRSQDCANPPLYITYLVGTIDQSVRHT
ncbi:hypothetical protein CJ030_MR3G001223 [Morella rubra]|uniref:Uncharacterized protein n=1 Tax=Morella rubra TaxID=262757 RepID=A0A6A1W221_9ROSI|nr:hypothetical protein CJ030_MR7G012041 [Morella rubra]KAB1219294.1 hypothetical protein CJ030_MR3G001223 [Morella rubra]